MAPQAEASPNQEARVQFYRDAWALLDQAHFPSRNFSELIIHPSPEQQSHLKAQARK